MMVFHRQIIALFFHQRIKSTAHIFQPVLVDNIMNNNITFRLQLIELRR